MVVFIGADLGRVATHRARLIDVLYHLGTFKLYVSIAKYIPQVRTTIILNSTSIMTPIRLSQISTGNPPKAGA
jgi:hypothetical protein